LRRELQAFEDRAFDAAYAATREPAREKPAAAKSSKNDEATSMLAAKSGTQAMPIASGDSATVQAARLGAVARKLRISPGYMDAIVAAHAEQYEARIAQEEAARRAKVEAAQASLLQRCGQLPTHAFNEVKSYLVAMGNSVRVRTRLNECLTPRLTEKTCWSVVCTFDELIPGELTDTSHQRRWTFLLKNTKVVDHTDRVVD
jgi:hypothetical protein